ncbi:hypothetical protein HZC32_02880 [Candidatus Woesearchaeota archaeon]|nr:hypothetical protein [Candidatus Woesearchaeota archaeon]
MSAKISLIELVPQDAKIIVDADTANEYFDLLKDNHGINSVRKWRFSRRFPATLVIKEEIVKKNQMKLGIPRSSKETVLPKEIEIDEQVGWLIGFWNAEGKKGCKKKYRVTISNSYLLLIKEALNILRKKFRFHDEIKIYIKSRFEAETYLFDGFGKIQTVLDKNQKYVYTKPHFEIEIVNKLFYDYLNNLLEKARNNKKFQRGYVAGIIDGDGYISKNGYLDLRMEKDEFSKKIHDYVKEILQKEGFPIKEYLKSQFRLQMIRKDFSNKLLTKFPIKHEEKISRLSPSRRQKGVPTAIAQQ